MSKLNELTQTHGKVDKFQPTTLDQILGDTGMSKYGTMDLEEYKRQLNTMNKVDLQAHATRIGLVPIDSRERLIKQLLREFNLYVGAYRYPSDKKQTTPEVSPEVARILAQGR